MGRRHLIFAAILGVSVLAVLWILHSPLESDAYLAANFARNEEYFGRIVKMMEEDTNLREIGLEYVSLENSISSTRRHEYLQLLTMLGEEKVYSVSKERGMIVFSVAVSASTPINDYESWVISKDYVYSTTEPSPLVYSLDWSGFGSDSPKYKRIADHWYLRFDRGVAKPE